MALAADPSKISVKIRQVRGLKDEKVLEKVGKHVIAKPSVHEVVCANDGRIVTRKKRRQRIFEMEQVQCVEATV
jgi:hypothetical protein